MHPREEQDQEERKRGEDERRKREKERRKTRREESSDSRGSVASDPRDLDTNSKSTTIKSKTDSAENFNIKKGDKIVNKSSVDSGDNGETDIIDDAPYDPTIPTTAELEDEENDDKEYNPGAVPDTAPPYTPSSSTSSQDRSRHGSSRLSDFLSHGSDSERERIQNELADINMRRVAQDSHTRVQALNTRVREIYNTHLVNSRNYEWCLLELTDVRNALENEEETIGNEELGANVMLAIVRTISALRSTVNKVKESIEQRVSERAEEERF